MNPYTHEKNIDQIVRWLQSTNDVNAVQYLAQETINRLRELHANNLANQYTTAYKTALTPQTRPQPASQLTMLSVRDGFNFGCGFYLVGFLISIVAFFIIFIAGTILGGGVLTSLLQ